MKENLSFLQAFLKNPTKVGAIAPSSPDLAREMVCDLKPDRNNIVLELGVGTGAITRFIEPILPDPQSYLGIELDSSLFEELRIKFPNLKIVEASAADAYEIHRRSGLGPVRYLLCCLPFVSLPSAVAERIYDEIDKFMEEGCVLKVFQYAHGYYLPPALKLRERMRRRYGRSRRSHLVLKNVPPAYTLTWSTL
ncbi:MAG: class I SAM-dependent methyltransferase [Pyrinomonadaceae bacterium]|jgi:phosphatidylethanolamine/phosphatidyl-N-methylethanolamine N-methyltransferase